MGAKDACSHKEEERVFHQGQLCEYLHMVYVTHTEAPRKEGKQSRVMKIVVIWLTLYGFLGA
ncbi:hypothetical protein INR49_026495 [Caranx melampygus]|nr:hypothetical protein INR49_026495 [Caranx melampygus]